VLVVEAAGVGIEGPCRTDRDRHRAAQQDLQALPFERRLEPADHGLGLPTQRDRQIVGGQEY